MGNMKEIRAKTLPPSSKYFGEEMRNLEKLLNKLDEHTQRVEDELSKTKTDLWWRINEVEKLLSKKMDLYAMQLYRKSGESNLDARIRLFENLPDADEPLLTYQKVNSKLLKEFSSLCKAYGLNYWMGFGSLVATLGRGREIPWDDDIDVCMLSEDIESLAEKLTNNETFSVRLVYDYYAKNRQYRFIPNDPNIHNFIDIAVHDWAISFDANANKVYREILEKMENEIEKCDDLAYWREEVFIYTGPDIAKNKDISKAKENIKIIESIFNKYKGIATEKGVLCARNKAKAIAFGLDNSWDYVPGRLSFIWDKKLILPTKQSAYNGIRVSVPNKAREFNDLIYPGWPYLPNDIFSHLQHFVKDLIENAEALEAMRNYLNEE